MASMRTATLRRRLPLVALLVASTLVAAGCSASTTGPGGGAATGGAGGASGPSATPSAAPTPAVPAPTITISPSDGAAKVALDAPVTVASNDGSLDSVVLHADADPTPLAGSMSPDGRVWRSTSAFDPGRTYLVAARAHTAGGTTAASASFSTLPKVDRLTTTVAPDDGSTVGVGMPITLTFDSPVEAAHQAAVVEHIQVQTSVPVEGAWHWFSSTEVHWRPKDYWPAHTKVTVAANLRGVQANASTWGLGDFTSSFVIGDKHVSGIDAAAHQMQVFNNDQLTYTYPVSTGMDNQFPTISGTLVVWYKLQKVHMVSTSIGIPIHSPLGYDEDVFWDTAISTDGFFIHSAPWSVYAQGYSNVSHGCVNLSQARATEFFNFSQPGDIVVVKNTSRLADGSDGEADWQIPFDQYANAGRATPAPAAATSTPGGA